jgi:hypothetical protein
MTLNRNTLKTFSSEFTDNPLLDPTTTSKKSRGNGTNHTLSTELLQKDVPFDFWLVNRQDDDTTFTASVA